MTTLIAGVMGWPVAHSRSPRLHGFWLREYGIDGRYELFEVPPDQCAAALKALPAQNIKGCNLTVPHKELALTIVDTCDELARRVGAVNTVVVQNGKLAGLNTDVFGFAENLTQHGFDAMGKKCVVMGAGGAARAVIVALQDRGAAEVLLCNRTAERATALANQFGKPVKTIEWKYRQNALEDAGLLVNTTVLGMQGQPPLDLQLDMLPGHAVVTDIVYSPLQTLLLTGAQQRGLKTIDGLGMLLHQARPGFKAWFGVDPVVTPALRAHVAEGL